MDKENELNRDILMHYHNVQGKTNGRTVRIHEKTTFLARERVVVHSRARTQQRFLPFLPLKHTETKEYLKIPLRVTTEAQLWDYVAQKQPFWLDRSRGRHRR